MAKSLPDDEIKTFGGGNFLEKGVAMLWLLSLLYVFNNSLLVERP